MHSVLCRTVADVEIPYLSANRTHDGTQTFVKRINDAQLGVTTDKLKLLSYSIVVAPDSLTQRVSQLDLLLPCLRSCD